MAMLHSTVPFVCQVSCVYDWCRLSNTQNSVRLLREGSAVTACSDTLQRLRVNDVRLLRVVHPSEDLCNCCLNRYMHVQ